MANELYIYDVIGESFWESGVTDKSVRDELKGMKAGDPLSVRVNSPGGSVSHAVAIKTMIEQWKGPVSIQIDGLAASAASYISMARNASEVTIADGSLFMIHNPWSGVIGDAKTMRKEADVLDKLGGDLVKAYADRTGIDAAQLAQMMDEETWLTADEAVAQGFATAKVEVAAAAFVIPEAMGFKHVPQQVPTAEPQKRPANSIAAMKRRLELASLGN